MACILLIEDDPLVVQVLESCLRDAGHRVLVATDGASGLRHARHEQPDVAILDVGLPDQSGFDVCRELRLPADAPRILMLTARDSVDDRVHGLDAGADDYLAKPFDERELLARVRALLRRQHDTQIPPRVLTIGGIVIDFEKRSAVRGTAPLALTKSEFALLEMLAKNPGKPASRPEILDVVLGYARAANTRAVDTLVWRLRKKIGDSGPAPRWIKHVAGAGYLLAIPATDSGEH